MAGIFIALLTENNQRTREGLIEVKMRSNIVWRFIARITIGVGLSIWLGSYLDRLLNTTPWIMLCSLLYVIIGSLYLLVKEAMGKDE